MRLVTASIVSAIALFAPVSSLCAQDVDAFVSEDPEAKKSGSDKKDEIAIELDLRPNFSSDQTQRRGDRLLDANATSALGLKYKTHLSKNIALTADTGVRWTSDFENGDGEREQSSFVTNAKLNWDRGFKRVSPFISYGLEVLTNDVFGERVATDHNFAIGADIVIFKVNRCLHGQTPGAPGDRSNNCTGSSPYKLTLIPSVTRIESTDQARERYAPGLKGKADFTLPNGVSLTAAVDYQHRMFDNTLAGRKTQDRILASGGVDFAKLVDIAPLKLETLFLGAEWLSVQEGGVDDVSKVSLLPVIKVRYNF